MSSEKISHWTRFRRWLFGWCELHQEHYTERGFAFNTYRCCGSCDDEARERADAKRELDKIARDAEHARKLREQRIGEIREGVLLAMRDFYNRER